MTLHRLYRNNGDSNNWIKFRLVGAVSNRAAIGAKMAIAGFALGTLPSAI